jgi:hypothetical protein
LFEYVYVQDLYAPTNNAAMLLTRYANKLSKEVSPIASG